MKPEEKEMLANVGLLWTAASNKKGRNFTAQQIAHIAGYLNELSVLVMQRDKQVTELKEQLQAGEPPTT